MYKMVGLDNYHLEYILFLIFERINFKWINKESYPEPKTGHGVWNFDYGSLPRFKFRVSFKQYNPREDWALPWCLIMNYESY